MTPPIQEPSTPRDVSGLSWSVRQLARRPAPPRSPVLHIKVFPDANYPDASEVVAGDGMFIFAISEDMDGRTLTVVEAYVTTVSSSGIVQVQLRNITQAVDMLSTRVQVDASEFNSKTAGTAAVIDTANATVAWADEIAIDVDQDGTGAFGLGVILEFS